MQQLINELLDTVEHHAGQLKNLSETTLTARLAPGKWSKKEIVGHLVDSAQNNIQRFVRTQYEEKDVHILYRQDDWVRLQNYQAYSTTDLLQLWVLLNRHLGHIWAQMDTRTWALTCKMGNSAPEFWTLEMLAIDYLRHLKHHLAAVESQNVKVKI
jgi:hypothetical protein